jgi:hypothetical protein
MDYLRKIGKALASPEARPAERVLARLVLAALGASELVNALHSAGVL